MTAEQFSDSKYKPVLMPMPFGANNPSANYDIPPVGSVSNAPNFKDGFPSAFSSPKSLNGQYVTRKQMNGIGNLATRYEFFRRVGGLNTFNADFAIEIGGYPRGCVLDFLYDNKLYKVLSLVDNNKVDFTGAIPTESQASHGITAGSVDGYNWLYCNIANQVIKYSEIADIPDFSWSDGTTADVGTSVSSGTSILLTSYYTVPIATFTAPKNGFAIIKGTCDFTAEKASVCTTGLTVGRVILGGFGIFLCKGTSNPKQNYGTSDKPYLIYTQGDFRFMFDNNNSLVGYTNDDVISAGSISNGQIYSIYLSVKSATVTNSSLKVIVQ